MTLVVQRLESLRHQSHSATAGHDELKTVFVDQAVVSLDVVKNVSDAVATIQIRPTAVVTPAVRDWLRDRNVKIEKVGTSTVELASSSELKDISHQNCVLVCDQQLTPEKSVSHPVIRRNTTKQLVVEAFSQLDRGNRVLVVTRDPESAFEPLDACPKTSVQNLRRGQAMDATANIVVIPAELFSHIPEGTL